MGVTSTQSSPVQSCRDKQLSRGGVVHELGRWLATEKPELGNVLSNESVFILSEPVSFHLVHPGSKYLYY